MKTSGFLERLLKSAQDLMGETRVRVDRTSNRIENEGIGGFKLGKLGQGVVAGGLLSMLLGSRGGRKLAKYGGLAAIGTLAYRAWRDRQAQGGDVAVTGEPQTIDLLPPPQAELHSRGILVAVIAAAKADGHIDPRELALIEGEIGKLGEDAELKAWLTTELERPLDPSHVAQSANTPELASEMYLASLMVVDEQNDSERQYLDDLARHLSLDPQIRASLERQLA
jgi:uncharacterized membrane protein YebE (DUF533 family)